MNPEDNGENTEVTAQAPPPDQYPAVQIGASQDYPVPTGNAAVMPVQDYPAPQGKDYPPVGAPEPYPQPVYSSVYPAQPGNNYPPADVQPQYAGHQPYPVPTVPYSQPQGYPAPITPNQGNVSIPMPADLSDDSLEVHGGCLCCRTRSREATDRLHFVRKVYMILFMQLLVTTGWLVVVALVEPITKFIRVYWPLALALIILSMGVMFALVLVPRLHKRTPWNYLLLLIFVFPTQTLGEAYCLSWVSAAYDPLTVLAAGVITSVMFISITVYVWVSPKDYNKYYASGCALFGAMFGFGLVFAFMSSRPLYAFFCLIVVALYGFYLAFDTELVLGKARTGRLTYDDYILGAAILYQDLVIIMMYVLMMLGSKRRN